MHSAAMMRSFGANGDDDLSGGSGDDTLTGGLGLDTLSGGRGGSDTVSYAFSVSGVAANLNVGFGYMKSAGIDADRDTFFGIENLDGGLGDDNFYGNDFANRLRGNGGNDEFYGLDGDDTLEGGAGNDGLIGQDGDDLLIGGSGDDRLAGGIGDDTLTGGTGDDTITGREGADIISGGSGVDWLMYQSTEALTVDLATNTVSGGVAEGDTISGMENVYGSTKDDVLRGDGNANHIIGNMGNDIISGRGGEDILWGDFADDTISGDDGNDEIYGGDGIDILRGGAGADSLRGGGGLDTFDYLNFESFSSRNPTWDVIEDFEQGLDVISIRLKEFFSLGPLEFIGNAAFEVGQPGEVRFFSGHGRTWIDINVDNDTTAEMRIELAGVFTLEASDFGFT